MLLGAACSGPGEKEPASDPSRPAAAGPAQGSKPLPKIAAIVTTFFPNSHAGVIVDKFLRGFPTDDGLVSPRTSIASIYIDQIHQRDVGRQLAHEFDIPIYESIRAALTLGGDTLAVDGVLLIGEHGDYPVSRLGQEMLPRRYFFEQIAGVLGEAERPVPVFNDKHLSYRPGGKVRRPAGTRPSGASAAAWTTLVPGATPAAASIPIGRDGTVRGPRPADPTSER